jgi:hypothetical protein
MSPEGISENIGEFKLKMVSPGLIFASWKDLCYILEQVTP